MGQERQLINLEINLTTGSGISIWGKHERGADYVLALKENQSKLFAAAARRYARSGARSVAERREPVTHDRCEWRRATVLRDATFAAVQKFPGVVALARITSRRRVLGACAEPPQVRYSCSPNIFPPSNCCASCAPIGDREPAALGARCRLQRGSQPNSERQRAREPRDTPKARPQSGAQPPRSHIPAPENQTSGMGRRLPLGHARSYAIALPLVGEGRLGREPSCKATERVARAVSTSTG